MQLTIYVHLVPRLRMRGAVPPWTRPCGEPDAAECRYCRWRRPYEASRRSDGHAPCIVLRPEGCRGPPSVLTACPDYNRLWWPVVSCPTPPPTPAGSYCLRDVVCAPTNHFSTPPIGARTGRPPQGTPPHCTPLCSRDSTQTALL